MKTSPFRLGACLLGIALSSATLAHAQASRTWVSGVGDDVNPCSRTAPCKTFAGAISKTAAGGEINALDPGGFGAVTITKSISIIAAGVTAGVTAGGNGMVINAGPLDSIYIDGLDFTGINNPTTTALSAIKVLNAGKVVVRNTTIRDFVGNSNSAAGTANGTGLFVQSASPVDVMLENVIISNSLRGIYASSPAQQRIFIRNSTLFGNSQGGITVDGKTSTAYVAGSTVFANTPDLVRLNGGRVQKAK